MVTADPTCVFCRIIAGELPSHRVFENDDCVAFLDVQPLTEGHVMVVPRHHCGVVADLPPAAFAGLMEGIARVSKGLREAFGADATTIGINDGPAAGQMVPHVHVHLFPRRDGDGGGSLHSVLPKGSSRPLEEVARALAEAVSLTSSRSS